ncbi:tolloid-like protein 2 [Trichonephila clavipes]|nr:tolloid-like protein 2 [Trichonephila clavipes]
MFCFLGCGGLIHTIRGNITSPNRPSRYDNNVECRWTIEYVPGFLVKLEFTGRFDIEMDSTCSKDYLMIEEYNELGRRWSRPVRKCGPSNPEPYMSKQRKIRITFHSNENINGDGFNIAYSAVCGGNFTYGRDEIFSPNYPEAYDNSLNCTYTIGRAGQYVTLKFDDLFSIENKDDCSYDSLEIYHGNISDVKRLGPYCGTEAPAPRTMAGPVIVKFTSDDSFTARGFRAMFEITGRIVACRDCVLSYHSIAVRIGRDAMTVSRTWNLWAQDGSTCWIPTAPYPYQPKRQACYSHGLNGSCSHVTSPDSRVTVVFKTTSVCTNSLTTSATIWTLSSIMAVATLDSASLTGASSIV